MGEIESHSIGKETSANAEARFPKMQYQIRIADPARDAKAVAAIYNPYIMETEITYEYDPVTPREMRRRMEHTMEILPWLAVEENGELAGYAYASRYHERAAYGWDCEFSVYLKQGKSGHGLGSALYERLFAIVEKQNYVNVYSLISLPNESSLRLHEKFGFEEICVEKQVGFKHGKWLDLITLRKRLDNSPQPRPVNPDWRGIFETMWKT